MRRCISLRLRLNDGEYLKNILSNPTQPSCVLCRWGIDGVIPGNIFRGLKISVDVVVQGTDCASQTSTWFSQKRSIALGIVATGSSLGGVIFPMIVIYLIPEIGFSWAMRVCAFVILALLVFANFTVKSRIEPTKRCFSPIALLSPLKQPELLLLTLAVFFFFCKFSWWWNNCGYLTVIRGNVHTFHIHRRRSTGTWHVHAAG